MKLCVTCGHYPSLTCAAQMAARTNSREAYKSYSEAITKANTRVTLRCHFDYQGIIVDHHRVAFFFKRSSWRVGVMC